MKPVLVAFVAGLLVGGAAVWTLVPRSAPRSAANADPEQPSGPVVQVVETGGPPGAGRGATASSAPDRVVLAGSGADVPGPPVDLAETIRQSEERRKAAQIEARLLKLKSAIALTSGQEEAIREFLGGQSEAEGPFGVFSTVITQTVDGDGADQVVEFSQAGGREREEAFEAFMRDLLDDDQEAGFDAFLERELANRIEARANADLAQLQSVLSLDPSQKEAAFAAFAEIAAENEAAGRPFTVDLDRRREALAPVLTPEQMAVWSDQPIGPVGFGAATIALPDGAALPGGAAISIRVDARAPGGSENPPSPESGRSDAP